MGAGIVAVVAGSLSIPMLTAGAAAATLLSQGKPATASSMEGAGLQAGYAVDGDPGTRWSSQFADPQWLQVDLGGTASITQVVLQWEAAYATAFRIEVSPDGSTWTGIHSTTNATGGTQTLDVTGAGRYVRMYGTARHTGYGYSLWEFEVYGSMEVAVGCDTSTNAADHRPAAASSVEAGAYPAGSAVDGNASTRWSSEFKDPQWLQVDLGFPAAVCQVVLKWEAAYARAFEIELSDDGSTWMSVYSTKDGNGGTQTLPVNGSGRYIRVYGTTRATGYGYSIWEFAVHTADAVSPAPTATVAPTNPPTTPPTGNWTKVWEDSFTGAAGSSPSPTNWIVDTGTSYPGGPAHWGTGEVEMMTNSTANVALDGNGHLNVTALNSGGGWTSGRIETQRKDFAAPAGGQLQITATLKQPNPINGIGYWPAFRALGAGYRSNVASWPAVGQIDIMEDVNGRDQTSATLHCGTAPDGPCNEYTGRSSGLASCTGCQTGYHTYSMIIDRTASNEQARWYLDGVQIWVVQKSQVGIAAWQAAVDNGFLLVFSLGIGGSFPDAVCGCSSANGGASSGGTLSIDSVAVYSSAGTGTPPAPLPQPSTPIGASVVKVTGVQGNWQLSVDGAPYQVKGLTWGPPMAAADAYMAELKSMGVNTLRTWGTDAGSKSLLDAAAARGLKLVNGFWLNHGADYVNDVAYKTNTINTIVQWVNTYKNHPGVLMWDVGNEVLLNTADEGQRVAYAKYVDQVAQAIHAADPNHPVTSTDAWTGAWRYYSQYTPHLDLYAVNSYGSVCGIKQDWINGGYTRPYILTEGGPAGEWEVPNDTNGVPTEPSDLAKRDGYPSGYNCLMSHSGVALGATLFHYGLENDFGGVWLSILTGGWKRLAYHSVRKLYSGQDSANTPPVIASIAAPLGAGAGAKFTVTAGASDPDGDPIRYNLMFSGKHVNNGTGLQYATFTQTGNGTFSVTAPQTLGVWKVYVYAYDGHGNVGIETRSMRVVPPAVDGVNLAIGKAATASSVQAPLNGVTFSPGNATDGNFATRWASVWADPQWIQVDLGAAATIHHIQIAWEAAYAKAYQIQTSMDGSAWNPIYTTTTGDGGIDDVDATATGRYVRVYAISRGTPYGYSLHEFGIYA